MIQTVVIGILIKDRIKEANRTLRVLSAHADIISTRLGFHEVTEMVCSRVGFILLHIKGAPGKCEKLMEELNAIGGIAIQTMTFE